MRRKQKKSVDKRVLMVGESERLERGCEKTLNLSVEEQDRELGIESIIILHSRQLRLNTLCFDSKQHFHAVYFYLFFS